MANNIDIRSYTHEHPERAYRMALLGLSLEEIAETFSISSTTIVRWQEKYPLFKTAITKGARDADAEVAQSLFKRATGYDYTETKVFSTETGIVTKDIQKHYPADTKAAIFWLKNRTRKNAASWTDKVDMEVNQSTNININNGDLDLSDLTDDELSLLSSISFKVHPSK